ETSYNTIPPHTQGCDFVAHHAASTEFIAEFTVQLTTTDRVDQTDALVLGVQSTNDGPIVVAPTLDEAAVAGLQDQLEALGVKGKADEVTRVAGSATGFDATVVVLTGRGSTDAPAQGSPQLDTSAPDTISAEALRRAAGAATAKLSEMSDITVALPADSAARLSAVAEGTTIGTYAFAGYKTADEDQQQDTQETTLKFVTTIADADALIERAG